MKRKRRVVIVDYRKSETSSLCGIRRKKIIKIKFQVGCVDDVAERGPYL